MTPRNADATDLLHRLHDSPAVLAVVTCDLQGTPLGVTARRSDPAMRTLEVYARLLSRPALGPPAPLTVLREGFLVAQVPSATQERTWALFLASDSTEEDLATFAALGLDSEARQLLGGDLG